VAAEFDEASVKLINFHEMLTNVTADATAIHVKVGLSGDSTAGCQLLGIDNSIFVLGGIPPVLTPFVVSKDSLSSLPCN